MTIVIITFHNEGKMGAMEKQSDMDIVQVLDDPQEIVDTVRKI